MKHRSGISLYVHKLPEASDERGATVSVWAMLERTERKRKKKKCLV